jgi:MFS family permease
MTKNEDNYNKEILESKRIDDESEKNLTCEVLIKESCPDKNKKLRDKNLCLRVDKAQKSTNPIDIYLEDLGYTRYHFSMIFILSMIYFVIGSEFVVINIIATSVAKDWKLGTYHISLMSSSIFLGVFITSLIAGHVSNSYGRRIPTIISCFILSLSSILTGFTFSIWQFCISKIFIGLAIGIMIPCTTSLLAESIPKNNRSFILNIVWILYPLGILYICLISIENINRNILNWRLTCIINSFNSILIMFLSLYLKESPRYLVLQGKLEEAFKILNLIGKSQNKCVSLEDQLKIEEQSKQANKQYRQLQVGHYFEKDFKMITPFLIFLWYSSSLISFGLLNVMPKHFENLTKKDKADSLKNMMISMYILFLCPPVRGIMSEMEFLGRKNTLAIGYLGSFFFSVCCIVDEKNLNFFAGSLNFFINISLNMVSVYTAEVYSTKLRSVALGIGNAFTRFGGITSPFICHYLDKKYEKGSFYLFSFLGLISCFISLSLSRETRGRDLDNDYEEKE